LWSKSATLIPASTTFLQIFVCVGLGVGGSESGGVEATDGYGSGSGGGCRERPGIPSLSPPSVLVLVLVLGSTSLATYTPTH